MDWPALITAISLLVGALGIKELIKGWNEKRTGAAQEEKSRMQELMRTNSRLQQDKEHLFSNNRKQKEYSSLLRRMLFEHGVPLSEIPDWPKETEVK